MLALPRSSSADSTKPLPPVLVLAVTVTVVSSRRCVRVGSIGRALKAAKLVLLSNELVPGVEGEEGGGGAAVLESRRDRRVAADGVRESGGGLRFVNCVVGVRVGVDGEVRIAVGLGRFLLGEAAPNVEEVVVDGCLSDTLER